MKDYTKQIEAWLNNDLTHQERQAFENAINQDSALEKEVKTQILERETAALFFEMELKEDLKAWKTQKKAQQNPSVSTINKTSNLKVIRRTWAIAAGFLLLFSLGMLWWFNQAPSNKMILADQYIEADFPGDKGETNADLISNFDKGLTAFSQKDYHNSIQNLSTITATDSNFIAAQYFLGHAFYHKKEYKKASEVWQNVVQQEALPGYMNRHKLKWNLLLSYLANGQQNETIEALWNDLIENSPAPYNQKAKELRMKNEE